MLAEAATDPGGMAYEEEYGDDHGDEYGDDHGGRHANAVEQGGADPVSPDALVEPPIFVVHVVDVDVGVSVRRHTPHTHAAYPHPI
jgi:hypothetical protein